MDDCVGEPMNDGCVLGKFPSCDDRPCVGSGAKTDLLGKISLLNPARLVTFSQKIHA